MAAGHRKDKRPFPGPANRAVWPQRRAGLDQISQVDRLLRRNWPALAAQAGLSPDLPAARALSAGGDEGGGLLVLDLKLPDGTALVLCRDGRDHFDMPDRFARSVNAQRMARLRMQGNLLGLQVPRVLAEVPQARIALSDAAPGPSAAALMELADSNAARRSILAACGRWLSGFHQSGRTAARPYQTRFALAFLRERREQLLRGRAGTAEPGLLLRLFDAVEAAAGEHDGRRARHAQQHGDYTLRNVHIAADTVAAVGFQPEHSAPAGHDVARILVDYVSVYGDHRKIADGQLLSGGDQAAFFAGYGFARPDDAAIGFLAGVQLIREWLKLPADPGAGAIVQALRLSGLRETAFRLFPDLRDA